MLASPLLFTKGEIKVSVLTFAMWLTDMAPDWMQNLPEWLQRLCFQFFQVLAQTAPSFLLFSGIFIIPSLGEKVNRRSVNDL